MVNSLYNNGENALIVLLVVSIVNLVLFEEPSEYDQSVEDQVIALLVLHDLLEDGKQLSEN
jgi:hypothetical protein